MPTVVTLHDLVPLKRPGEYLRFGLRFKLRYLAVQRATRVIVPTRAVADDAMAALGIPAERIVVIAEAAAPVFWPRSAAEVDGAGRGSGCLIATCCGSARCARRIRASGWPPWPRPGARCRSCSPVRPAGGPASCPASSSPAPLSDDELAAIYTGAHALVFPSDDEGFGLPPVEALACGTPVAACDVPALREVLGGRVALSHVGDLETLVRTAEALSRPAPSPPPWTWDDVAAATWDVYEQARSAASGRHSPRRRHPAQAGAVSPNGGRPRTGDPGAGAGSSRRA